MGFLTWFMGSRLGQYLAAIGAALVALVLALANAKRQGKKEAEHEFEQDKSRRIEAGREKVRGGRDSGLSPAERVRRNDSDWRGM